MHKLKEILSPALSLFFVCLCAAVLLAATNAVTKGAIAKQNEKKLNATMANVIAAKTYTAQTAKKGETYYIAQDDNSQTLGYIFTQKSTGYNGDVSVMVGINPDGTVKAVEILDASGETPGLGQRVSENSFLSQFIGNTAPFDNSVNIISGATYSSKAVIQAVNSSCELYANITGGAANE